MKILILFIMFCNFLFASCPNYSSITVLSGFIPAYAIIEKAGNGFVDDIKNFWDNDIKNILDSIKKEAEKKEKLLLQINNLKKESLIMDKKIDFLLSKEAELLGNQADIEAFR